MWGNNNVVPLYVMKNQTITLHQNSKEQNLSPQNICGNNNVGLHTFIYGKKIKPKHYIATQHYIKI
jgi:hypothetical protein